MLTSSYLFFQFWISDVEGRILFRGRACRKTCLSQPGWSSIATTTSIAPSAAGALSMRYRAQLDALRISSTPTHPMSGQAQDFLLNCFVSRCEPGGEAYFLQLSTRRVHTSPNACFPVAWNGASR